MDKELVMYSRTYGCPYVMRAKKVLDKVGIPYREVFIDRDEMAMRRVVKWTGFESVPTLIVARPGELVPFEDPKPLPKGESPRGINRGSMITEPDEDGLKQWLMQHGLLEN